MVRWQQRKHVNYKLLAIQVVNPSNAISVANHTRRARGPQQKLCLVFSFSVLYGRFPLHFNLTSCSARRLHGLYCNDTMQPSPVMDDSPPINWLAIVQHFVRKARMAALLLRKPSRLERIGCARLTRLDLLLSALSCDQCRVTAQSTDARLFWPPLCLLEGPQYSCSTVLGPLSALSCVTRSRGISCTIFAFLYLGYLEIIS